MSLRERTLAWLGGPKRPVHSSEFDEQWWRVERESPDYWLSAPRDLFTTNGLPPEADTVLSSRVHIAKLADGMRWPGRLTQYASSSIIGSIPLTPQVATDELVSHETLLAYCAVRLAFVLRSQAFVPNTGIGVFRGSPTSIGVEWWTRESAVMHVYMVFELRIIGDSLYASQHFGIIHFQRRLLQFAAPSLSKYLGYKETLPPEVRLAWVNDYKRIFEHLHRQRLGIAPRPITQVFIRPTGPEDHRNAWAANEHQRTLEYIRELESQAAFELLHCQATDSIINFDLRSLQLPEGGYHGVLFQKSAQLAKTLLHTEWGGADWLCADPYGGVR